MKNSLALVKNNFNIISLFILGIVVLTVFSTSDFKLIDDAYISFRYAYHLADMGELVFNYGERVEGTTNLLWILVLAFQFKLFNFPADQFTLFLSLGLILFSAFRFWQLSPLLGSTKLVGVLAALFLVLNPEFIGAATNGLEASLYSALLIEIIYRYCRNQLIIAYLCSGLLFMTRPEGAFLGFILIGLVFAEHKSIRKVGIGIAILGGIIVLVTLFRLLYYGSPLPNSIIAKSFDLKLLLSPETQNLVISYFSSFVKSDLYLIIIFTAALLWVFKKRSFKNKSGFILLFCIVGIIFSFIVTIRNGGDWMDNHRLLVQYGVLYSLLLISLVQKKRIYILFAWVLLIIPMLQTIENSMSHNFNSFFIYEKEIDNEDLLKRLASVISVSDTVSAEALGYLSFGLINTPFHDPVGLTDKYIAKHGKPSVTYGKHNSAYTVGVVKPALMVWHTPFHIKGIDQKLLDNYETFCSADCNNWDADVVMIRRDRLSDLAPAFSDWQKIKVESNWIGIK